MTRITCSLSSVDAFCAWLTKSWYELNAIFCPTSEQVNFEHERDAHLGDETTETQADKNLLPHG